MLFISQTPNTSVNNGVSIKPFLVTLDLKKFKQNYSLGTKAEESSCQILFTLKRAINPGQALTTGVPHNGKKYSPVLHQYSIPFQNI